MNRMIGVRRGLDFVDHRFEPVLEFALDARAGLQQAQVERAQGDSLQRGRHVAGGDPQGETLDDGRLADARLAGEDRIVLPAAGEDVDDLADFGVAAQHGIDLPLPGAERQVDGELVQRGRLRGTQRLAGLARRAAAAVPAAGSSRVSHDAAVMAVNSRPSVSTDIFASVAAMLRPSASGESSLSKACSKTPDRMTACAELDRSRQPSLLA